MSDEQGVTILVEFPDRPGLHEASLWNLSREELEARSKEAQHDDDVVVLQLTSGVTPLGPEQIAVLGRAEDSFYRPFRSYGYRRRDKYVAGHAHGRILGDVERPADLSLQADPVELESAQINRGMSGAAVLDIERNLVVGVISEVWQAGASAKDRDAGWAVNVRVLSLAPLNVPLREEPLAKGAAPQPRTDVAAARGWAATRPGVQFHGAPPPLQEWVGREELLASLTRDWNDPERLVTGLIGFGGEGKSSVARRWVDGLLNDLENRFTGVFWWGFYERPGVDEFFEAALAFMSGGRLTRGGFRRRAPGRR